MNNKSEIFACSCANKKETVLKQMTTLAIKDEPLDIAVVGFHEIAALLSGQIICIKVSDDGQLEIRRTLYLDHFDGETQYSLAFWRNSFYVANKRTGRYDWGTYELKISFYNINGHPSYKIPVCPIIERIDVQLRVTKHIYCSVFNPEADAIERNTVYCFDEETRIKLWQFSDYSLGHLYGITSDLSSNVYVSNGENLTVISNDGKCYRILINDILPSSDVYYDDTENCLVLCSENGSIQLLPIAIILH